MKRMLSKNRIKVEFTCIDTANARVVLPKGTRFTQSSGCRYWKGVRILQADDQQYRTLRVGTFGFWRRLLWRWRCWRAGEKLPQTVSIPIERVG